jgi:hypothetical protein
MERKRGSGANRVHAENNNFEPRKISESEVAFGPHREVLPGEVYDPEDLTSGLKLIPIRKYGPGLDQNKPEES